MADVLEATVKYPPNGDQESNYEGQGMYTDALITLPDGNEVNIYASRGDDEYFALWALEKGDVIQVLKSEKQNSKGFKYELTDSQRQQILQQRGWHHGKVNPPNGKGAPQAGQQGRQRQGGQQSGQNGRGGHGPQGNLTKKQAQELAKMILSNSDRISNLTAKIYVDIQKKIFEDSEGNERELYVEPDSEDIRTMTNTIMMEMMEHFLSR